jgi:hypothetical protein
VEVFGYLTVGLAVGFLAFVVIAIIAMTIGGDDSDYG